MISAQWSTSGSSHSPRSPLSEPYLLVSVTDPVKLGNGVQSYISYRVITKTNFPDYQGTEKIVIRRYTDFVWLRDRLFERYKGVFIPPLPEKSTVEKFRFSAEFIELRRQALDIFVNRIASHNELRQSEDLRTFLQADEEMDLNLEDLDNSVPGAVANLLPNQDFHCSMTGIYAQSPLVPVDMAHVILARIPIDVMLVEHPVGARIAPSGLHLLRTIDSSRSPHKELLAALAERWWPSTNTFHFAWGEMTMTPTDFSAISGIPLGIRPLEVHDDWRRSISPAQMRDLIGVDLPRTDRSISRVLIAEAAQEIYDCFRTGALSVEQVARFTILLLISACFYSNKKQAVDLGILRSLEDLSQLGDYDWAGAMMSRLFEDMTALIDHHTRVCSISYFWEVWVYEYFPSLSPRLVDSEVIHFPVSRRWFSSRVLDARFDMVDRRSVGALRTFFDTGSITEVVPDIFGGILTPRVQENPRFRHSIQRTGMRFLLPHPTFRRYYLGERVTLQYLREYIVPMDPPFDMTMGGSIVVMDEKYDGTHYVHLVSYDADYDTFRAARLMPPIGDRFASTPRVPRASVQGPSSATSVRRGVTPSHRESAAFTSASQSAAAGSSIPSTSASGGSCPPGGGSSGHMRVPPSVSGATGRVDPSLMGIRLPYEVSYMRPGGMSYFRVPVEQPDRSLPVARITEVPEGYVQDLTDYISGLSTAFSGLMSGMEYDRAGRAEQPRRRARR